MYAPMLEGFRKAAEATVQVQQEVVRQWASQVARVPFVPAATPGSPAAVAPNDVADRLRTLQGQWSRAITRALERHRELLDAQYKAGIRILEDALRVGEAKDLDQYRRLVEELWRHACEALGAVTEARMAEFRAAVQDWSEATSKGLAGTAADG